MAMTSGPRGLAPRNTRSPGRHPPELPSTDPGGQDAEHRVVQDVEVRAVRQVHGGRDQEPQVPDGGGQLGSAREDLTEGLLTR
eukprot:454149-Pyramimonas_sp.AAC.1